MIPDDLFRFLVFTGSIVQILRHVILALAAVAFVLLAAQWLVAAIRKPRTEWWVGMDWAQPGTESMVFYTKEQKR